MSEPAASHPDPPPDPAVATQRDSAPLQPAETGPAESGQVGPDEVESGISAAGPILRDGERLQKVLARAGLGSRRVCEELIEDGRVRINGEDAVLGARLDVDSDVVEVDGVPLGVRPGLVYYLVNKPAGVVTTAEDTHGRPTVIELVPSEPRVHPVGRLDMDTEGLLLLTNDGTLTHRLTHPSFGVEKEYVAQVRGTPGRGALRRLREGVDLDDGPTAPARASSPAPGMVKLVLHEGRNRQVRRMCDAVGHPVTRLVRTRIGSLRDTELAPGEWRELTTDEVRALERAVLDSTAPTSSERADDAADAEGDLGDDR